MATKKEVERTKTDEFVLIEINKICKNQIIFNSKYEPEGNANETYHAILMLIYDHHPIKPLIPYSVG